VGSRMGWGVRMGKRWWMRWREDGEVDKVDGGGGGGGGASG